MSSMVNGLNFMFSIVVALLASISTGKVLDIPGIWAPLYPLEQGSFQTSVSPFLKQKPSDFVHPGLWHTHEDLERMRDNVIAGVEPWASAFAEFSADSYSLANYTMQGAHQVLSRGTISNYTSFTNDSRAAWQNSLMWYITKDQAHWDRATTILDAWGSNLTDIIGIDRTLLVGLDGNIFANAAEIMRWEGNWTEAGAAWQGGSGFSNQLYFLFRSQSAVIGQANYGMVSIESLLSFAVYLDDVTAYNYAINEYINNPCAGVSYLYEPTTGQCVESGRDQGHTRSSLAWSAYGARVAQSQGADLYSIGNNRLLLGSEYTAQYNLNHSVVYDPMWFRCEAVLVNGPWAQISASNRGVSSSRPVWDILYYEYLVKRGLPGPWTARAKANVHEGHVASNDEASWGDLIWAYPNATARH